MAVATISPLQSILDNRDKYPKEMYEKTAKIAKIHKESYRRVIKAGIKCAIGSDLFGGPGTVLAAGDNGKEIVYAVEAGMTPLQAIEAATANGPLTLGPQAPASGQIKVGYDADFIGLEHNPLNDITLLASPKAIKWIWKAGRLMKAPGLDPWEALAI
jgi:imidazolonepropionase-like amidohydrolase